MKKIKEYLKFLVGCMFAMYLIGTFATDGQNQGFEFAKLTFITLPIGLLLGNWSIWMLNKHSKVVLYQLKYD